MVKGEDRKDKKQDIILSVYSEIGWSGKQIASIKDVGYGKNVFIEQKQIIYIGCEQYKEFEQGAVKN